MLSRWFALLAVLGLSLAAPAASAQVVVVGTDFGGELGPADAEAFRDVLREGLQRANRGAVMGESAAASRLGSAASCRASECMSAVGATLDASLAVTASVYAEAEIYDFEVRVYDARSGAELVRQTGDCTFCPVAEALESFGFTAEAALAGADLPSTPQSTPPVAAAPGPTSLSILTVPDSATISIDGEVVGAGRFRNEYDPGTRTIEVIQDGYSPYLERVTISEAMADTTIYLRVVLSETARTVEVPVEVPIAVSEGPDPETLSRRRAAGGVLLGVGLSAAGVGIGLLALDGRDTCETGASSQCPEVYEMSAGGAALTAVGGIAAGTGIGLLLSTRGARRDRALAWQAPAVEVGRAGWSAQIGVEF